MLQIHALIIMKHITFKRALVALALIAQLIGCSTTREEATSLCNEALRLHWGEWDIVIEIASEAIRLDPKFAWPYSQRGAAYNELEMYREAERDLQKAIELDPDFGAAYTNLSISFIRSGHHDDAKKYLERAYELSPTDPVLLETMAEFHAVSGNLLEACEWFSRALENGYGDWNHIETTERLNDFRNAACYNQLIQDTTKPSLIFESP